MPARSYWRPTMKPGDVLQKDERDAAQVAELDEVGRFERRLGEEHAVVGHDPDQKAVQPREAGHQRGPVSLLELVESRPVDEPGEDFVHVVRLSGVCD